MPGDALTRTKPSTRVGVVECEAQAQPSPHRVAEVHAVAPLAGEVRRRGRHVERERGGVAVAGRVEAPVVEARVEHARRTAPSIGSSV